MRLRNVTGAKEKIENCNYVIDDPKAFTGKFNELFNNNNPINLEIGMGKGNFIINMAKKYPNENFIGIEKFDSVIVRAIDKLNFEDLPNLKLIRMDADLIDSIFCHEIDKLYLNFSDPWPKERHKKRRLTSSNFLAKYENIFKNDKKIIFKTDNRHLFEFSIIEFTSNKYDIEQISLDLYKDSDIDNVPTEYETRFHLLGYPIYRIKVTKK